MSRRSRSIPPQMPSSLGKGRYQLGKAIGVGGMAVVFKAWDAWEKEARAVKVLMPHGARNPKTRTRFLKEARTMSLLDHPHIIRIFDVGEEEGHNFFVMELLEGGNLATYVKKHGRMSPVRVLHIMFQVLQGLDYAHTAGVVHRDIKPHNMVFDASQRVVKLTDFGIARVMAGNVERITASGDTLGTLAYMAPEQRADPRDVGPVADLYGVGATTYLLVTGRRPLELALSDEGDCRALNRVPESMRNLVALATANETMNRFTTAREMAEEVSRVLQTLEPPEFYDPPVPACELMDDFEIDDTIVQVTDEITLLRDD
ncbi:MAG: serine/threonine protein kinase [Proteobacteria bacterium]|nr:serine/threonine protein kinase [Pseudomonadota bacterium]